MDNPTKGDNELTDEALRVMELKLPDYVVKYLVASGFDTLNVISCMDISRAKSKSIEVVENYISEQHPDWLPHGTFSPGHRLRLELFVEEIKKSATPKKPLGKSKRVINSIERRKKPKTDQIKK